MPGLSRASKLLDGLSGVLGRLGGAGVALWAFSPVTWFEIGVFLSDLVGIVWVETLSPRVFVNFLPLGVFLVPLDSSIVDKVLLQGHVLARYSDHSLKPI